jgi:hypothetical protein
LIRPVKENASLMQCLHGRFLIGSDAGWGAGAHELAMSQKCAEATGALLDLAGIPRLPARIDSAQELHVLCPSCAWEEKLSTRVLLKAARFFRSSHSLSFALSSAERAALQGKMPRLRETTDEHTQQALDVLLSSIGEPLIAPPETAPAQRAEGWKRFLHPAGSESQKCPFHRS